MVIAARHALSAPRIEALLDELLEVEFTFRQTADAAARLATLDADTQHFMIDWIKRVASTNLELGYQVACRAVAALDAMPRQMIEEWALRAMDVYDRKGLRPALLVIEGLDAFASEQRARARGAVLERCEGVLQGVLHGLSGRALKVEAAARIYTDSEKIFLPQLLAQLPSEAENFSLYKVSAVFQWARTRFGGFSALRRAGVLEGEATPGLLALFHRLEGLRLEGILSRELPGLYRELTLLGRNPAVAVEPPSQWAPWRSRLMEAGVSADDVLALARRQLGRLHGWRAPLYYGEPDREALRACMEARIEREKGRFRVALAEIQSELRGDHPRGAPLRFGQRPVGERGDPQEAQIEILLDDQPLALPPEVQRTLGSIIQDLDALPQEYLSAAGAGEYDAEREGEERCAGESVWSGTYHEEGASLYPEWDYRRKHYRKEWCAMREIDVEPVHDGFAEQTLVKYGGLVKHLRKSFEALRDEERLLRRQPHGDGVDIDALVEALAEMRLGREMSDRLFTRMHRSERNIAAAFMVDMSGSTKGWINDAEREALVLLCEALESLGDRYAIYGFSSNTRKRCELFRIKRFDEPYGAGVRARISGIRPRDYTRMGFAIRHLTRLLNETDARTRILITLSDGKPDDYDNYRGVYGIEDTRRALIEARRARVHPYCITIDELARDYLPHLYGPAAYTVLNEVSALPLKVSDIYRRLTS